MNDQAEPKTEATTEATETIGGGTAPIVVAATETVAATVSTAEPAAAAAPATSETETTTATTESQPTAQTVPSLHDSLIFEGGALHGGAYVAALEEAERVGLVALRTAATNDEPVPAAADFVVSAQKPVRKYAYRFAGTSIGAAFAAFLACGATTPFLREVLTRWNPAEVARDTFTHDTLRSGFLPLRLLKLPLQFLRDVWRFYYHGGVWRGIQLQKLFADEVERLTGNRNITLKQVHDRFKTELLIVATALETHEIEIFSHRNHSDMPLAVAVTASMSVPGLFPWVEYGGRSYVDGGVLRNLYTEAFDELDAETGERDRENVYAGTLAFKLVTSAEVQGGDTAPIRNVVDEWPRIIVAVMDVLHREHQHQCDFDRTVRINVHELHAFDFNLTDDKKALLDQYGREGVAEYCVRTGARRNSSA